MVFPLPRTSTGAYGIDDNTIFWLIGIREYKMNLIWVPDLNQS